MAQTNLNIRMDEELKQDFDNICNEFGMTMTTAINVFAKTVVRWQKIPFEISLDVPNVGTIAAIEEIERLKKNPNKKLYSNFAELLKEIENDI